MRHYRDGEKMETISSGRTPAAVESSLAREYGAVLRDYLNGTGEAALECAYELGRRALAEGLGALDMARLHHRALITSMPPTASSERVRAILAAAERLFVESMTPYEMTHRGFKETNVALRASEARYRELFENAHDIVFTTDLDGKFTSVNRAGERRSGYPRHEALSMTLGDVLAPESAEALCLSHSAPLVERRKKRRCEVEILTRDRGRVPLEVNTRVIYQDGRPVGLQGIARDITDRKQAEQALRRVNERLEEEARRIAHALHDQAGQLLAAVYLAVAEIASELPNGSREKLQQLSLLLDQVTEQLRHLSHELRPIMLDDLGLVPAIEFLACGFSKRTGLAITIESSLDGRLPARIETTLYRIVQEALTNVSNHAQSRRVDIRIRQAAGRIRCTISDDGIGFDPTTSQPGLGLLGIRERLAALGGTLSIATRPGRGTRLGMKIPL
jgi:PAS domain S-box-containing protein